MVTMTWSILRVLGNAPIMRITVVAPFLPYILSIVDYFIFVQSQSPSQFPSTDWAANASISLHLFYFGGSLLGIASAIYLLYCPTQMKRYKDAIEYAEREAEGSSAEQVQKSQLKLRAKYAELDLSRVVARRTIAFLYVSGFLLVLTPPTYRFFETALRFVATIFNRFPFAS